MHLSVKVLTWVRDGASGLWQKYHVSDASGFFRFKKQ